MTFETFVAFRFLKEGRTQTALILTGIAVGVGTIVFLSALINGLQESIIERTLGNQAHIVIRPPKERPRQLQHDDQAIVDARVIVPPQRLQTIRQWQRIVEQVSRLPEVRAVVPTVNGPGFALRGNGTKSVAIRGLDPESYSAIVDLTARLTSGSLAITGFQAVVGIDLAQELGLGVGDRIRLLVGDGTTAVFTVRGTVDIGNRDLNERWVLVPLRAAQTLFAFDGGVSTLEVKVSEIFDATDVANRVGATTGLLAESWMQTNAQLLVGLRSQSSSSIMIQTFVILAVALGIASVLAVSVVQKSREIGIMMAYGTTRGAILRIFLLQGGSLGLIGSVAGVLLGIGLGVFFAGVAKNADGSALIPVQLRSDLYVRATLIATATGLLAAVIPARSAARLDPAVTIRNA